MSRFLPTLALLVVSSAGCDDAAEQQRANDAQRAAIADELKLQGETQQNAQGGESATGDAADDAP